MRGQIKNRDYKARIADMSGLTYGKITPTDLDMFLDFGDTLFVFAEAKYHGSAIPYGQRLALERLCDACHQPPKRYAVSFLCGYEGEGDIDFANMDVLEIRWNGRWRPPNEPITLGLAVDYLKKQYT
jgi:hypothetical protein